jgi:hypothetical protein
MEDGCLALLLLIGVIVIIMFNGKAQLENFGESCYGAATGKCQTCDDVMTAYKNKGWAYNKSSFDQCKPKNTSCYGASGGECKTCADVVNAYKNKGWGYNAKTFDQCK